MSEILVPADEAEASAMIRQAAASRSTLEVAGGGSRAALGRPVEAAARLETGRLAGIERYEPSALSIVVRAGTPLETVQQALDEENQRFAFEPMDHRSLLSTGNCAPTIGGVVACGVSGPRRIHSGACRDSLIGVRFVTGAGDVVKNGGRVMKNVTGYDLVKLLCGSYGTLGVLTEVSFKLVPRPETEATVVIEGLMDEEAVAALCAAVGSPYDVTGAAHVPEEVVAGGAGTLVRVEGFEASVRYRAERLVELLADGGEARVATGEDSAALWDPVRDCRFLAHGESAVWRVSVRPTDGPELVALLAEAMVLDGYFYDWAGGLVWIAVADRDDAGAAALRRLTARLGGHATLVRASPQTRLSVPVFEPQPAVLAALSDGLRAKFDPLAILNPGRMRAEPAAARPETV